MKIQKGDFTVGDIGVTVEAHISSTLTGINIRFDFVKPSGAMLQVDATSTSGYITKYTTTSATDLDESGEYAVYVYNKDTGYYFAGGGIFTVRPQPGEMAVA